MKDNFFRTLCILIIMSVSTQTNVAFATESVNSQNPDNIIVTNNTGKSDTIYVGDLLPGDVVKVYNAAEAGKLLNSVTVPTSKTEATVSVSQLGTAAGNIYVSVKSKGMLESDRVGAAYSAEPITGVIDVSNIIIDNNAGTSDTVKVSSLSAGDVVKVYNAATGGKVLGSATVAASGTDVTVTIAQLGTALGSVYISLKSKSMLESDRIKVDYSAEPKTNGPNVDNIAVNNNAGTSDTVNVSILALGDVVKVYNAATGGKLLGSATVSSSRTDATVTIAQLSTATGNIYVSVKSKGMLESDRVAVTYPAEPISETLDVGNITVTNNAGTSDKVNVTAVSAGDVVKVYNAATGGKLLGSATVSGSKTEAVVTITQLGTAAGSIYVSITSKGRFEGSKVGATYTAEATSVVPDTNNIAITNNIVGTSDKVNVTVLSAGDVVKVYNASTGGKLLGSATVAASKTEATVTIAQLGTAAGSVYVSITSTGMHESARSGAANYSAESMSNVVNVDNITVTNNAGTSDTIKVTNLAVGNVVKVYDQAKGGNLLGSATVATSTTEITVTVSQLGTAVGSVYVSVTGKGMLESSRVAKSYSAESASTIPVVANITIINNVVGTSDTVKITGLSSGDVMKIYDQATGGSLLGSATVATTATEATVTIAQLGTVAGSVYASITSKGQIESNRIEKAYSAELKTGDPLTNNITVVNNAGIQGTVKVIGLLNNDIVKVYDSATDGKLLGSATVSTYATEATVSVTQLGSAAGKVYVTVTSTGKTESNRTPVDFSAKAISDAPLATNITVDNNAGIPGTVKVIALKNADIVNVYDLATGGTLLGSATVSTYATEATVSVTQLGAIGGNVYVTVTSTGKTESPRTVAPFLAKVKSTAPGAGNVTIENNAGIPDTVKVTGLDVGDVINVYTLESGGSLLGSATVPTDSMIATASITQLGNTSGSVYISVTTSGKTESNRTSVNFLAESVSDAPATGNIIIVNNSGISDTVTVAGLLSNDVVKVYNLASGGSLLSSATVSANNSSTVIISIQQIGASNGSIFVSVTSSGKSESSRTQADYVAESTAPVVNNITIVNNAGISDIVKVVGLQTNSILKVYDSAQGGVLLASETVSSSDGQISVTIPQLTSSAGSVYVSITTFGRSESARTKADYIAELNSDPIFIGNVTIVNNPAGTSDTVQVTNLSAGDSVKVYDQSTGGTLLGSATVANASTQATVTIAQLGTGAGSVYISHTSLGKKESVDRLKVEYTAGN